MNVQKVALPVTGAAALIMSGMVSASAATHYTADACPSSRTTMMCLENTSAGQTAFDDQGKDNKTLDDWAYPGGQTEIATHLNKVIVYSGCSVVFYTGHDGTGSVIATVNGTNTGASANISGTASRPVKSFRWVNC